MDFLSGILEKPDICKITINHLNIMNLFLKIYLRDSFPSLV